MKIPKPLLLCACLVASIAHAISHYDMLAGKRNFYAHQDLVKGFNEFMELPPNVRDRVLHPHDVVSKSPYYVPAMPSWWFEKYHHRLNGKQAISATTVGITSAGATRLVGTGAIPVPASGTLVIGAMAVKYTSVDTSGSDTTFLGIPSTGLGSIASPIEGGVRISVPFFVAAQDGRFSAVWTPQNMGAKGDGKTDDTTAIQGSINVAVATGVPLFLPGTPGSPIGYKINTSTGLIANCASFTSFVIYGAGQTGTTITNFGTGPVLEVENCRWAYEISNLWLQSSNAFGNAAGQAGLVISNAPNGTIKSVTTNNVDVGSDQQNNCYGTSFYDCNAFQTTCNVGMYLRGQDVADTAGSGSDELIVNPWISGKLAGIWMGPNQGGFHIYGGQLGANNQGGSRANDMCAGINAGLTYTGIPDTTVSAAASAGSTSLVVANATKLFKAPNHCQVDGIIIAYSGVSGNTLTGIPASGTYSLTTNVSAGDAVVILGGVNSVGLHGCSFEGVDFSWDVRMNGGQGWSFDEVSFNANHPNPSIGVFKAAYQGGFGVSFRDCGMQGKFSNPTLFSVAGTQTRNTLNESGTFGAGTAHGVFFIFAAGANCCTQSGLTNGVPLAYTEQGFYASGTVTTGSTACMVNAAGYTVTLPPVASYIGQTLTIKNMFSGPGSTVLKPNGNEQIDGNAGSYHMNQTSLRNSITLLGVNFSSTNQWIIYARASG